MQYVRGFIFLLSIWLSLSVLAQTKNTHLQADIDSLTKEMYRLWPRIDKKDDFKNTTDLLKKVAMQAGETQLFWRAWSNQATFFFKVDRKLGMTIAKEMLAYAKAHDDKYGLYISTYTNASHASTLKMEEQAEQLFMESISYKERFLPDINAAADYLGLAKIYLNRRLPDKVEEVVGKALQQPGLLPVQRVNALAYRCYVPMTILDTKPTDKEKYIEQFYRYYADMDKARKETNQYGLLDKTIDIYKAQYDGDYEKMLELSKQLRNKNDRLAMMAHTYTHMGRWQDAYETHLKYKKLSDSLNSDQIRRQSAEHALALDAARADNEAKDLRLANQALELAHITDELRQRKLEEEALNLSLENQAIELKNRDIELQNAAVRLKNDSLDQYNKDLQLKEWESRMEAQKQNEHAHHIFMLMLGIIGLLAIGSLAFFLHRRNKHMKEIKGAYDKLETTYEELEQAYGKLETTTAAKERMESELRIAREIQMGMVPRIFPAFPGREDIDIFASLTSAREVGGDLYDFFLQSDKLYFCIGDVSGKGIPASMFMSVVVNIFRMVAKEGFPPAYIATKLNDALSTENENGMFVTMFIGEIHLRTGRMDFCNAGHNPPVIIDRPLSPHAPSRPSFIEMESNAPIGLWSDLEFIGESIENIKNRTLFLYTDGLTEAENLSREQFGEERLLDFFNKRPYQDAKQTISLMNAAITAYVGEAEPSDDLTMLCIKVKGSVS